MDANQARWGRAMRGAGRPLQFCSTTAASTGPALCLSPFRPPACVLPFLLLLLLSRWPWNAAVLAAGGVDLPDSLATAHSTLHSSWLPSKPACAARAAASVAASAVACTTRLPWWLPMGAKLPTLCSCPIAHSSIASSRGLKSGSRLEDALQSRSNSWWRPPRPADSSHSGRRANAYKTFARCWASKRGSRRWQAARHLNSHEGKGRYCSLDRAHSMLAS
mmetsp:Transcript_3275/g.8767  ORF Transcript_3275/g.8767 Transcript_3275/m.8767 type:complete len:220 (-) Transcript_3275:388-1047(-)